MENHHEKSVLKSWVATLNNYTEEECVIVTEIAELCTQMTAGFEIGEEGTPHLQMAMTFRKAMRFAGLKKLLPRAHWEAPRASMEKNFEYCRKDKNMLVDTAGKTKQGERTDIQHAYACAREGKSMEEFMEACPNFQAIRVFEKAKLHVGPRGTNDPKEVIWLYGPTGSGKSRWAWDTYPDLYEKTSFKWWDGYDGHETVLIDDFRGDFCKFHELLKLLDRYKYRGEIKGGTVEVTAKRFIITCPFRPEEVYVGRTEEDIAQLTRRITTVTKVDVTVTVTEVRGNTMPGLSDELWDLL